MDKLLELIRDFSKFAGHKVNMQIPFMSYISNNHLENEKKILIFLLKVKLNRFQVYHLTVSWVYIALYAHNPE